MIDIGLNDNEQSTYDKASAKRWAVERVSRPWIFPVDTKSPHLLETSVNLSAAREVCRDTQHWYSGRLASNCVRSRLHKCRDVEDWCVSYRVAKMESCMLHAANGAIDSNCDILSRPLEGFPMFLECLFVVEFPHACLNAVTTEFDGMSLPAPSNRSSSSRPLCRFFKATSGQHVLYREACTG
jgi:hypothetical protein